MKNEINVAVSCVSYRIRLFKEFGGGSGHALLINISKLIMIMAVFNLIKLVKYK